MDGNEEEVSFYLSVYSVPQLAPLCSCYRRLVAFCWGCVVININTPAERSSSPAYAATDEPPSRLVFLLLLLPKVFLALFPKARHVEKISPRAWYRISSLFKK